MWPALKSDRLTAIPAEHRGESDADAGRPAGDDDGGGEARRAAAAVVVRVADGVVALDGDRQQTEDGDLRQHDDDRVDRQTAEELARQTLVGQQHARYACMQRDIDDRQTGARVSGVENASTT